MELRASFEETGNGKDAKDNMIINFAKFIKENWVDDEAKMNEVILAKQKECFQNCVNAKEAKKADIDNQIAETAKKLKEAESKEEQNEYVQRQIEDYKKAIEILNEEKKSIIESQEENIELQK